MPVRSPIALAALLLISLIFSARPAMAEQVTTLTDCKKSPFSGSWVSDNPDVPFLSKLEISDICKQIVSKPASLDNPWAGELGREKKYIYREFTVRPSSTCAPVDCAWGRAKGAMGQKGSLSSRFRMFWSKRYLKITRENNTLLVRWRIEYTGRKKPDQLGETRLVRVN